MHSFTAYFAVDKEKYDGSYNGRTELVQVYNYIWTACDIDNKKDYYMVCTTVECNNDQLNYKNEFKEKLIAGPFFRDCEITSQLGQNNVSLNPKDCSPYSCEGSKNFKNGLSFNIKGNVGTTSIGPIEDLTNGITISDIRERNIPDILISLKFNNMSVTWIFDSPIVEPSPLKYYDGAKEIQITKVIFDCYAIYKMDSHNYWSQKEVPLKSTVKIQINMVYCEDDHYSTFIYRAFPGCATSDNFSNYVKKPCNSYCNYIIYAEYPPNSTSKDKEMYNTILKQLIPIWGRNVKYYGYCDTSKYSPTSTNGRLDILSKRYFSKVKDTITKKKEELKSKGFSGKFKFVFHNSETDKDVDSFELTF